MRRHFILGTICVGMLLISGCEFLTDRSNGHNSFDSPAEAIQIEGVRLVLEASLWRDLMPGPPPQTRPLFAQVTIEPVDDSNLPVSVSVDSLWVIHESGAWATPFEDVEPPPSINRSTALWKLATTDAEPHLMPGVRVDVVVRVRSHESSPQYLISRGQVIGAAW
jgi:hypothetical protein